MKCILKLASHSISLSRKNISVIKNTFQSSKKVLMKKETISKHRKMLKQPP